MKKALILILASLIIISSFLFVIYKPAFTGKAIVGTTLVITLTSQSFCNISLSPGWNLVSFPCISSDADEAEFLGNFTFSDIRTYDASDAADPWKSYNPSLPSYVIHDLETVSRAKGYWIYVANESEFIKNGTLARPTFIALERGWNLIGMPNLTTMDTYNAFEELIPQFDYVYLFNASENDWKEWTWNSSLASSQDLNKTTYNFGYWIYMLNESTYDVR